MNNVVIVIGTVQDNAILPLLNIAIHFKITFNSVYFSSATTCTKILFFRFVFLWVCGEYFNFVPFCSSRGLSAVVRLSQVRIPNKIGRKVRAETKRGNRSPV